MKIAMGSIPILVIAAVIEGFITPLKVSPWLKLLFAGFTAIALTWYIYRGSRTPGKEDNKFGRFIPV